MDFSLGLRFVREIPCNTTISGHSHPKTTLTSRSDPPSTAHAQEKRDHSRRADGELDHTVLGDFGIAVRARGILLEMRVRLPKTARKSLDIDGNALTLAMKESDRSEFDHASAIVSEVIGGIETCLSFHLFA